MYQLLQKLLLI